MKTLVCSVREEEKETTGTVSSISLAPIGLTTAERKLISSFLIVFFFTLKPVMLAACDICAVTQACEYSCTQFADY